MRGDIIHWGRKGNFLPGEKEEPWKTAIREKEAAKRKQEIAKATGKTCATCAHKGGLGMVLITVEELIAHLQPEVYRALRKRYRWPAVASTPALIEMPLEAAYLSGVDKYYAKVMQERPMPGRGGLLPGEREEELYAN